MPGATVGFAADDPAAAPEEVAVDCFRFFVFGCPFVLVLALAAGAPPSSAFLFAGFPLDAPAGGTGLPARLPDPARGLDALLPFCLSFGAAGNLGEVARFATME